MAHTFTITDRTGTEGAHHSILGNLSVTSYVAGGVPTLASDAGIAVLRRIRPVDIASNLGYTPAWDPSAGKLRFYKGVGGTTVDILADIKGGVNASHLTDQASAGVNSTYVHAAIAGNNVTFLGAGVSTGFTNPDYYGRNLNIELTSFAGATAVAANIVVTGTFTDGTTSETIAIPVGAIAAGKYRNQLGAKVCLSVTNIKLTAAQPADILVSVGLGTILGLSTGFAADTDVKASQKAAAKFTGWTATAANQGVDLGVDLADAEDYLVEYVGSRGEAASGTNVGTLLLSYVGD